MLPVAPAGTGQPPSSPKVDSKESMPDLERGEHVGQALAAGVVEVRGELDVVVEDGARLLEEGAHLQRVGHAGGVAEADLLRAGAHEPAGDLEHALGRRRGPRRGSRRPPR